MTVELISLVYQDYLEHMHFMRHLKMEALKTFNASIQEVMV